MRQEEFIQLVAQMRIYQALSGRTNHPDIWQRREVLERRVDGVITETININRKPAVLYPAGK